MQGADVLWALGQGNERQRVLLGALQGHDRISKLAHPAD